MSTRSETVSLYQFLQRFPGEEAARKYFETNRWAGKVSCPHCGSRSVALVKDLKPMPYRCRDCRQHFSVRTGTVLAESRLPLHKWLLAIYMITTARKGIPSTQMARELGVTQKSAWFLAQRIRETWLGGADTDMGTHVQVDETFIGGKEKNKHANKKLHLGLGAVGKVTVVAGEYVRHYCIHTNCIKSFWALLKRGHYGIYHYMSPEQPHCYVNEFAFRQTRVKLAQWDLSIKPLAA